VTISEALSEQPHDGLRGRGPARGSDGRVGRASRTGRRFTLRSVVSGTLVVLAVLLVPVAATGWWVRTAVSDTERYLAIVAPLVDDPKVQHAAAAAISKAAVDRLDIGDPIDRAASALGDLVRSDRLSAALAGLKDPIRDGLLDSVTTALDHVMASDAVAHAWRTANATAHRQAIFVIEGRSELASTEGGVVRLELGPVIALVLADLTAIDPSAAALLRGLDASVPLFSQADLERLQSQYRLLMQTTLALPALVAVLMLLAVVMARRRSRALVVFAIGAATLLVATPLLVDLLTHRLNAPSPEGRILVSAITEATIRPLQILCYLAASGLTVLGLSAAAVTRLRSHAGDDHRID
jgi:hypothetical protein